MECYYRTHCTSTAVRALYTAIQYINMEFDTTSVYLVSNFEGDRIINYAMKKCLLTGITIIITVVYPQLVESKQQLRCL